MKRRKSCDLWRGLSAGILAVALIVTGIFFAQPDGSQAMAEASAQDMAVEAVTKISDYRTEGSYTYPQPTETDKEDYLFAGWYTTEDCTTRYTKEALAAVTDGTTVYAKYVPSEILGVKFQAAVDATTHTGNLRVVSTIDVLSYQEVGFEILSVSTGVTKKIPATEVYKRVQCKEDGVEFGYSPIVFDTDSQYFQTGTINNITDFEKIYSARAYWVTPDGTTVYGTARNARISDSYQGIANVPVRLRTDVATSLTDLKITYNTDAFTYIGYDNSLLAEGATVTTTVDAEDATKTTTTLKWEESQTVDSMDGMLVNLRFKINSAESSNVFDVASDSLTTGLFGYTYNAYNASYDGGEADTSWYDNYSNETEFVIATANDLYGLASLVNGGTQNFADNKTVYLGADVIVNTADTEADPYLWTAIGQTEENAFAGIFDGDGHSIKGINYSVTETADATDALSFHGLFGVVADGGKLQEFRLEDSSFTLNGTKQEAMGSIAGLLKGSLNEVYSEADVSSTFGLIGGLAGQASPTGEESIVNCWYNGAVVLNKASKVTNYEHVGGLIGAISSGTLEVKSCLAAGDVTCTFTAASAVNNKAIGGFVGRNNGGALTVSDSVMASHVIGRYGTEGSYTSMTGSAKNTSGSGRGIRLYVGFGSGTVENSVCRTTEGLDYELINATATEDSTWNNSFVANNLKGHVAYSNLKDIINVYDAEDKPDGAWAIRTYSDTLADSVPVPKCFTDDCIDVAWYYNDTAATEFTISTANELYGLASISIKDDFTGDKITLADDITLNEGDADDWAAGYTEGLRVWTPIGQTTAFAGTFDGQEKTINGIYMKTDTANAGLFGQIAGATIQDFRLENSFFENTNKGAEANLGSVIGQGNGTLQGVYSNATVYSIGQMNGGLVGAAGIEDGETSDEANKLNIVSCQFDGTIKITQKVNGNTYSGGFVGAVYNAKIDTCLNTGTVIFSREAEDGHRNVQNAVAGVGGLIGGVCSTSSKANIVNTISVADMTLTWVDTGEYTKKPNGFNYVGTLIGLPRDGAQTIANVYNAGKAYVDVYTKTSARTHYLDANMGKAGTGTPGGAYLENVSNNQDGDQTKLYDALAENLWFEDELIDVENTGSAYWRVIEDALPIPVRLDFGAEQ